MSDAANPVAPISPVTAVTPVTVAALYRFATFDAPRVLADDLRALALELEMMGTLILAPEGINGTVAGSAAAVETLIGAIRALPGCADLSVKYAHVPTMPFVRMKVKVKREIVTLGAGELSPATQAGTYINPADWNALIADPDTILIDTRNSYEVAVGTFAGAIDPGTETFREFPAWFDGLADQMRAEGRSPKIAMFCTGGIRCEKSTALAKARGFDDVYHLNGGILRYLEEVQQDDSLWSGDCFVFDKRVAVGHGLAPGHYAMCRPCGRPYRIGTQHECVDAPLVKPDDNL